MLCRTSLRNPLSLIGFARIVPYFARKRDRSPVFVRRVPSSTLFIPLADPATEYLNHLPPGSNISGHPSTSRRSSAKLVSSSRVQISHARGTFDRKIAFSERSIKDKRTFETPVQYTHLLYAGGSRRKNILGQRTASVSNFSIDRTTSSGLFNSETERERDSFQSPADRANKRAYFLPGNKRRYRAKVLNFKAL